MALPTLNAALLDVTTCQPSRCPDGCDDQADCVIVAVSEVVGAATSHLLVNLEGGEIDGWDAAITLTGFGANAADRVLCLGDFVIAVSTADLSIIRSDDRGTTQVEVTNAVVTDWTAHAPTCIDGLDQTYILMGGTTGYVYRSLDAGRTWETVDEANATAQTLAEIMIARDNPLVAYAVGGLGHVIRTDNGGETWYAAAVPSADPLLSLLVVSQSHVLVINDDGEIWETTDSATTWTQQITPPGGFTADVTQAAITGCGCDVMFMTQSQAASFKVWRNVDGGASGFWRDANDITGDSFDLSVLGRAITCCNGNRAIVVGGATGKAMAALIA